MAIVEDEVRNESEEENEVEVVVEEDDGEQDSDDSDDDDDEEVLQNKVTELECRINKNPYNYEDHIELIQALWGLSDLETWRVAFERLQQLSLIRAEHWLLRLQTEITLAHSAEAREHIADLFQQATQDCYSIPIFSEWCSWALSGEVSSARTQLDEVLRRAGPDPLSGRLFWDARLEFEKSQLENMSAEDPEYKAQADRVCWAVEESAMRPLVRTAAAWTPLKDLAAQLQGDEYRDKLEKQHEVAMEYLEQISPFEDKLLISETPEEKCSIYLEYIDKVKELSQDDKYADCDSNGILKVLYERATTECLSCVSSWSLLTSYARLAQTVGSRSTARRVLAACVRRCPSRHTFWTMTMQQAEHEGKDFDEVKSIFEKALARGMESYKETESLWMSYLEYIRRQTSFDSETDIERLRRTFRLAWDSLAEAWGDEANDCEVPLFWARLEYRRLKDPRQGKEIFEEIFKYGENKKMSKYWEALISLEWSRSPLPPPHKHRELLRRALRFVHDYPPSVARLWTDFERDYGQLDTMQECVQACEPKLKEWRDSYEAMKEKMSGKKQKGKPQNKQSPSNKKTKFDNKKKKKEDEEPKKGKRKSDHIEEGSEVKRKREENMEVDEKDKASDSGGGVKRSHDGGEVESTEKKRQRTESESSASRAASREACTLFVSNLEFKVDEQRLRDELSKYGDIVSLRVKAGVKAFGGSICYCQYKTPESVEAAIKQDRSPLDGRPMFLSRYSAKKSKPSFKYATTPENNKLFVKNLPYSHCTKEALTEIFNKSGKLKDVRVVTFKDGKPKGLAYIEFEDEASAKQALQETNGSVVGERTIEVLVSAPPPRDGGGALGGAGALARRENTGGMRRTQLSSFIPSVLQKAAASTSKANGNHGNGDDKRPLSNADFRSLLLK